jgi:hypothetical protein
MCCPRHSRGGCASLPLPESPLPPYTAPPGSSDRILAGGGRAPSGAGGNACPVCQGRNGFAGNGNVAQRVEQQTKNLPGGGSNPPFAQMGRSQRPSWFDSNARLSRVCHNQGPGSPQQGGLTAQHRLRAVAGAGPRLLWPAAGAGDDGRAALGPAGALGSSDPGGNGAPLGRAARSPRSRRRTSARLRPRISSAPCPGAPHLRPVRGPNPRQQSREIAPCDDRTRRRRETMEWINALYERLTGVTRVTVMRKPNACWCCENGRLPRHPRALGSTA